MEFNELEPVREMTFEEVEEMMVGREFIPDREFIKKLNELDLNVKFETNQTLSEKQDMYGHFSLPGPRIEFMKYTLCDKYDRVILKIIDTENRARIEFINEKSVFDEFGFDDLMKIFNLTKLKVDELNKLHEEIKKQELSKTELR